MKFARAMNSGVGLHCPDLTAGAPVYTPDELGVEDPDGDVAPVVAGEGADDVADQAAGARATIPLSIGSPTRPTRPWRRPCPTAQTPPPAR